MSADNLFDRFSEALLTAFKWGIPVLALFVVGAIIFSPHVLRHDWRWTGGEGDFNKDYGECRSQALLGGFMSPNYDTETLNALMRGRGWNKVCAVCEEIRWER